ncbi:MAG TPA: hypothetical protein VK488_12995 [Gaiellaceae bacterium]|nr:hypothetical protein [Gaiellaceae bacterium]
MKLQVAIPRWFLVLFGAGLVLAVALAVAAPFAVYMSVVVGWYLALLVLFAFWARAHVRPLIEQARERGEWRPYVELRYPPWARRVAASWLVLFLVSSVTGFVLLVIAIVELRLR